MDNETRQYGPQGGEPRRERPRQYFPDQSLNQYQQPQPQPRYEEHYAQPAYEQPYYDNGYEPEAEKGTSAGAIALGVFAALSFIAAVVLAVLWRGAAAEADKPPVTETSTVTQTTTETKTETTTKFPSIFRDRDNLTATLEPEPVPAPDPGELEREIRDGARDILDQLRGGADEYLQEQ
ncbi:hypothetical protein CAFEA_01475 [Corynebacterium afermentans subsp. afermentans]|uniref:Uncharacterized protein n=1 Tax=Corynebacterium afermentans TaxID=38286 RepID=A0A9X8R399_9CORY|nr:hypothetical protein [Corynebacterium afermentans]OAA16807.1 hypothetical protein Caferm_06065 [Corynebacterium afermentans subsp. afermentans]WJY55922.1 hypothetical protein CAFEA_01475 [Corynebacterium afermentans subsp. afermentans]SIQ21071.1 hypothetical protein SAMN05421802_10898 [Corynebacterium afermentans]